MKTIDTIIRNYTAGEADLEAANAVLAGVLSPSDIPCGTSGGRQCLSGEAVTFGE